MEIARMKCPADNETLVMTDRSGVEIDDCPKCRGVWLDRGELDKIVERAGAVPVPPQQAQPQHGHHYGYGQKPYYKKKESFLGELFDF